jgi:hypothetical protein
MKFNQMLLIGTFSLLVTSVPLLGNAKTNEVTTNKNYATAIAKSQQVAIKSGNFMAAEKPTTGTARIVTENGHRYLEFNDAFSTSDQGPDLHVLLDTTNKPPQSYKDLGRTINLGRLRNYKGTQRYEIPDVINISSYKSVVIWCRMANATFGYASLNK